MQVVEDRVSHPWLVQVVVRLLGAYEYYQFDNWLAAPGFLDWLHLGPASSIARAVFPRWERVRVLKESLFYRPRPAYPGLLAPLHQDCALGSHGCPDYEAFRLWVSLDDVPAGRGVIFQRGTHNDTEAATAAKVCHISKFVLFLRKNQTDSQQCRLWAARLT